MRRLTIPRLVPRVLAHLPDGLDAAGVYVSETGAQLPVAAEGADRVTRYVAYHEGKARFEFTPQAFACEAVRGVAFYLEAHAEAPEPTARAGAAVVVRPPAPPASTRPADVWKRRAQDASAPAG